MYVPQMRRYIGLRSAGRAGRDVTDFGWSGSRISSGRGICVDIGDCGAAELVCYGFQNLAGSRILNRSNGAADLNAVADANADPIADVDDEGVSADVGNYAGIGGFNDGQGSRGVVELRGAIGDGFVYGFAEDGLGEVAAAHVKSAAATAVARASTVTEEQAAAGGFAVTCDGGEDFAGGGIHEASGDGDHRFRFFFADARKRAGPAAVAAAHAADLFVIATELGDGAEDDGVHAEDAADFGGAGGIGAVAVVEVLFGNDLVESGALDDSILSVLNEFLNHEVGDAFADVLVGAEDGGHDRADGAVVKVHDGYEPFGARGRGRGRRRRTWRRHRRR